MGNIPAWEEIGLDINEVEVIGTLPKYYSGSQFIISPVVGLVREGADFKINRDEVDYMFEVPLAFLMNPDNHLTNSREFREQIWYFYEMPYEDHYIWGVTAGMIAMMRRRMFAA